MLLGFLVAILMFGCKDFSDEISQQADFGDLLDLCDFPMFFLDAQFTKISSKKKRLLTLKPWVLQMSNLLVARPLSRECSPPVIMKHICYKMWCFCCVFPSIKSRLDLSLETSNPVFTQGNQ